MRLKSFIAGLVLASALIAGVELSLAGQSGAPKEGKTVGMVSSLGFYYGVNGEILIIDSIIQGLPDTGKFDAELAAKCLASDVALNGVHDFAKGLPTAKYRRPARIAWSFELYRAAGTFEGVSDALEAAVKSLADQPDETIPAISDDCAAKLDQSYPEGHPAVRAANAKS